jgi:hypothetical protein
MSDGSWYEMHSTLLGHRPHWSSGYPVLAEVTARVLMPERG